MKAISAAIATLFCISAVSASGGGGGAASCSDDNLKDYLANEVQTWIKMCPGGATPGGADQLVPAKSGVGPITLTDCCTPKETDRCKTTNIASEWANQFIPKTSETEGNTVCSTECTEAIQAMAWNSCFWRNWNAVHGGKKLPDCCAEEDSCKEGDRAAMAEIEKRALDHKCYFKKDGCRPQEQINAWAMAGGIVGGLGGGCMRHINWGLTFATVFGSMIVGMLGTALIGQLSMWWSLRKKDKNAAVVDDADDGITEDDAVVGEYK